MKKKFKKEIASLDNIFIFIAAFANKHQLGEAVAFPLNFAIEEIFTNMVKYSSQNALDVEISLTRKEGRIVISLTEFDVAEFDITKIAEVDTNLSLKERKIGGLGLHLTRKVMDGVAYEYRDRNSKITLTKHLEK